MANQVSEIIAKGKNNPLGLLIGAGAGFLIAKKLVKTQKTWVIVVVTVVGAIGGAMISSSIKAHKSAPTKSDVVKK